jgi:predicted DCC family thiol-disulfide oxidoreductase YuxK
MSTYCVLDMIVQTVPAIAFYIVRDNILQDKYMLNQSSSSKYILAYDADCGPCTRFRNLVDILDKYENIDFMPLTEADQKGLLDVIPAPLRYESFHLIFPNGEAKSGSEALLELIVILPGGKMISSTINYLPGGKHIVRSMYQRFSRLHDTGSCRINNNNNNNNNNNKTKNEM